MANEIKLEDFEGKTLQNIPKSERRTLGDGFDASGDLTIIERDDEGGFFDSTGKWIVENEDGEEGKVSAVVLKEAIEKGELK